MKNFLFIILSLSMAFTIHAQDNRQTEEQINKLTESLVQIQKSRSKTAVKSERVYQVIKQYLSSSDTRSLHADLELLEVLDASGIKSDEKMKGEREVVMNCITQSLNKISGGDGFVSCCSSSSLTKVQCEKAKRALKAVAVRDLANPKEHCKSGNCDFNDDVRTKSRGVADLWVYQGERKFFNEKDMFGWRYRCVKMSQNDYDMMMKVPVKTDQRHADEIEEKDKTEEELAQEEVEREANLKNDMVFMPGDPRAVGNPHDQQEKEYSWKKEENVDRW